MNGFPAKRLLTPQFLYLWWNWWAINRKPFSFFFSYDSSSTAIQLRDKRIVAVVNDESRKRKKSVSRKTWPCHEMTSLWLYGQLLAHAHKVPLSLLLIFWATIYFLIISIYIAVAQKERWRDWNFVPVLCRKAAFFFLFWIQRTITSLTMCAHPEKE